MRTKFKAWTKPYIDEHPEVMVDLSFLKETNQSFTLEIGSGKGKFLMDMANKFPEQFFVGVERNVTCAGITAKKLVDNEIQNAKLAFENADVILDVLKDNSVENIILNFSDPWPKKRHSKRRLTAPSYLKKYYRVLKPNGHVYMKTDNENLFDFSLENLVDSPFIIVRESRHYQELDTFDTLTEYEENFRKEGKPIYRLVLVKHD